MIYFRTYKGKFVDALQFTQQMLTAYPATDIHVGTDSQNYHNVTKYATVIAYRRQNTGVTFITLQQSSPRVKDMWTRLWKEAEMSIEVAEWLSQHLHVTIQIDMDYNENQLFKSNAIIAVTKGWATSLGYVVNVKPNV